MSILSSKSIEFSGLWIRVRSYEIFISYLSIYKKGGSRAERDIDVPLVEEKGARFAITGLVDGDGIAWGKIENVSFSFVEVDEERRKNLWVEIMIMDVCTN